MSCEKAVALALALADVIGDLGLTDGERAEPAPAPEPAATPVAPSHTGTAPPPIDIPNDKSPVSSSGKSVSGVQTCAECVQAFDMMKKRKAFKWIIYKVDQQLGMTVIDTAGGPDSSHEDFLAALPDDQPRFAVLDKVYINKDECRFDKIVFALYNPDSARIKQKMLYASSKDAFKGTFQGVSLEMQATDTTELDDESVMLRVRDVITRK
eukprot:PRCOL_00003195-RA